MNEYKQTELEIEIAKENLKEICAKYHVTCTVLLGEPLVTVLQDVPLCSQTEDCWPEVVAVNIPQSEADKYIKEQNLTNAHKLIQKERIQNDYKH